MSRRRKPQHCRRGQVVSSAAVDQRRLERLADVAFATGELQYGRWQGAAVVLVPDELLTSVPPELGPLPATPRLYRADGRYVDVFRVPEGGGDEAA